MYYPKSQIKTNLYTNGGEYILSTNQQNYKGYYYEISNGNKYTGKFPNDGNNTLLIPTPPSSDEPGKDSPVLTLSISQYDIEIQPKRYIPTYLQSTPTPQDYTLGEFTRYFCKKTNELKYIEINKETHNKLKNRDPKIAWDLYEPQSIIWQISGDKEQTFLSNKNVVFQLEQRQKWYGFSIYLKEDYLKYYLED
jgi:hypothetical protein